jgi:tight adherence protein C
MGLALFSFIAVFLLIGSAGLLMFYRAAMLERLSAVIAPHAEHDNWLTRLRKKGPTESIKAVVQPFDKVLPKSPKEVSVTRSRLIRAGYRDDSAVRIFYGAKVLVPLWLTVLAAVTGVSHYGPFFVYALALGVGYLVPDFWVGHMIKERQLNIRVGLPEFLDLMVVCIEAGLSMDQALARSADELRGSQPEIADEMGLLILEQRAGKLRVDSWRHLAERVDIDVMRALVSAVIQADQYGTSIAKTLRVYSDTLRTQRRQNVEEQAAKTPVKLVFPLVLFIFPSLFVVVVGPALIVMSEGFAKWLK